jgi:cytochrome c-type biogenesis protein CcsB
LLFVFGYLIAVATFIENQFGTTTARIEIFRSKWIELILILLAVNFIGNIKKYRMFSEKKWTSLTFHLAFVVIIIGAGVTRYFGFEGMMPIREGQTENIMYSSDPYLNIEISNPKLAQEDNNSSLGYSKEMLMAETTDNEFYLPFNFGEDKIEFSYVSYVDNADYKLYENIQGGGSVLHVVTTGENGRKNVYIESGKAEFVGSALVSFNNPSVKGAVNVIQKMDSFMILSPFTIPRMVMASQKRDTVQPNVMSSMKFAQMHQINGNTVVFKTKYDNAIKNLETVEGESEKGDALKIQVKIGEDVTERVLFGGPQRVGIPEYFSFMGYIMRVSYGAKTIKLPFNIRLDDFILERYNGSNNPSGYKSEVTLYDESNALTEQHSIFMNNVLDYKGYRFFQSSYDPDEKGTRLSVNHDYPGTLITYIGYFLLGLGFVLTIANKNSRFTSLIKNVKSTIDKKSKLVSLLILLSFSMGYAQNTGEIDMHGGKEMHDHSSHDHDHDHDHDISKTGPLGGKSNNGAERISIEHADQFGRLLVQGFNNDRYEPINTLAYDICRKLNHSEQIVLKNGEEYSPEQFLLEMMVNGKYFEDKKIIYLDSKNDTLLRFLGVKSGSRLSFLDFFEDNGKSKVNDFITEANQKAANKRTKWDNEMIKIAEKLDVFFQTQRGDLLRIFPSFDSSKGGKWISIYDDESIKPLKGTLSNGSDELDLSNYSYMRLFAQYLNSLRIGEYKESEAMLVLLGQIQRKYTPEGFLPSQKKVQTEIEYNKNGIFSKIKIYYILIALFLLPLAIVNELNLHKKNGLMKIVRWLIYILSASCFIVFMYHAYGLALRWYLTGHAPWSNGYEALIFISWTALLAGFIFYRFSKIVLPGAALIAFFIIAVAGFETMDPQLTSLVPVLKSYWLIIHVACMTSSYGFFGLAAVLGFVAIIMSVFKTIKNAKRLNLSISGLTYINEMVVIVGVVLAAVGTFLGGVWANESWGRYWGWDAKETWALIIVLVYAMQLHFRFVPGLMKTKFFFNAWGSTLGFGSVCMTYFGVNYYFSNSIHSYAAGDPPAFPVWIWQTIIAILVVVVLAGWKDQYIDKKVKKMQSSGK